MAELHRTWLKSRSPLKSHQALDSVDIGMLTLTTDMVTIWLTNDNREHKELRLTRDEADSLVARLTIFLAKEQ